MPRESGTRLGERVTHERQARGWTQGDLAFRAGIDQRVVAHVEAGRNGRTGSAETVLRLAPVCGWSTAEVAALYGLAPLRHREQALRAAPERHWVDEDA